MSPYVAKMRRQPIASQRSFINQRSGSFKPQIRVFYSNILLWTEVLTEAKLWEDFHFSSLD